MADISEQIEKHRATLDRENPRDFTDVYLIAMEEDEGLNIDDLILNLFDFLIAGTETLFTNPEDFQPERFIGEDGK